MKKALKIVFLLYFLLVLIKAILAYLIPAPSEFSDGYIYMKLARSFFYNMEFSVHGIPYNHYHPLYPLLISISYLFGKMSIVYPMMKIINSIISSLIIFPAYLLAKEFLTERKAVYTSLIISLLPSSFIFSSYILAENLFYPLFLLSVYLLYKAFSSDSIKYGIFAGVSIGLAYLTKVNGIALFGVLFVLILYSLYKKKSLFPVVLSLLVSILIISPWIIRNFYIQDSVFGGYTDEASTILDLDKYALKFLINFLLYSGILILSAGIIFPIKTSGKIFKEKYFLFSLLSLSAIFFILVIASNHNVQLSPEKYSFEMPASYFPFLAGRLIGRYIDAVIPLMIILGAICLNEKITLRKTILFSALLAFTSFSVLSRLLPINHVNLAYLGAFNYFLNFPINLIFTAVILVIVPFIIYKISLKKLLFLLPIFFILLNILNFSLIYYNSSTFWEKGEQMQLGIFLDDYSPEVLFDERDCTSRILKTDQFSICEPSGGISIIGSRLNDNILIGNVENTENMDFIISRHELPYPKVKTSKDNIFIYSLSEN